MHILLVASAFNSLTQRVHAELSDQGYAVGVELALGDDDALRAAVARHAPQLIVAPMLTTAIPEDVWRSHTCLIVHPGPPGDRGDGYYGAYFRDLDGNKLNFHCWT